MNRMSKFYSSFGIPEAITIFSLVIIGIALPALCPMNADAQVFYAYPGAPVVSDEQPALGPFIAIGDDLFRLAGYGRFNVTDQMDMGLELVFDLIDDDWFAGAGVDLKYSIIPVDREMPFDLSLNGGIGFTSGNDITMILAPVGGVISRPLKLSNGNVLTPYGGVYVLIEHISIDAGPFGDFSDTDTDVELRAGVSLRLAEMIDIFTALHIGSGNKFYTGLNFRL